MPETINGLTLGLALLIIFTGALIQSLIGFGLAVVASPLLYLVEPDLVPVPVILMGFSIALLTLLRERSALEFGGLQYALLGRIPGGILGATLLLYAPKPVLGLAIAAIVFVAVALSLCRISAPVNRLTLFIAGTVSGVFGTIAAIGGPPMAILLAGKDPNKFRAALSAFFIFSSMIALGILAVSGLVTSRHLLWAVLLLPAVVAGYLAAGLLLGRVDKQKTRVATLVLCSLSALLLTLRSLATL
ncbi:TSUP family transporter [Shewanella sp. JM162201]|uniref:Probable membrane transporter protein n=1 Tax=Shewanella jiangmenensis TaxID=2837387 RepID=A0ABS5V2H8_9GAMM|nr:sulfite exporter TauE/SafE family protein [Shewanella jiangmenensis]MBT1444143.1 TSUP family transporter [Shewanella jiangmenensis]